MYGVLFLTDIILDVKIYIALFDENVLIKLVLYDNYKLEKVNIDS